MPPATAYLPPVRLAVRDSRASHLPRVPRVVMRARLLGAQHLVQLEKRSRLGEILSRLWMILEDRRSEGYDAVMMIYVLLQTCMVRNFQWNVQGGACMAGERPDQRARLAMVLSASVWQNLAWSPEDWRIAPCSAGLDVNRSMFWHATMAVLVRTRPLAKRTCCITVRYVCLMSAVICLTSAPQ